MFHSKSIRLKKNVSLICCDPKAFISWVERPIIFSTFLECYQKERKPRGEWKKIGNVYSRLKCFRDATHYGEFFSAEGFFNRILHCWNISSNVETLDTSVNISLYNIKLSHNLIKQCIHFYSGSRTIYIQWNIADNEFFMSGKSYTEIFLRRL